MAFGAGYKRLGGNAPIDGIYRGRPVEVKDVKRPTPKKQLLSKLFRRKAGQGQTKVSSLFNKLTSDLDRLALGDMMYVVNSTKLDPKQDKKGRMRFSRIKPIGRNRGGGISGGDSIPALLTPGEFVVNAKSAKSIGYGNLSRMNRHGAARFNKGGIVGFNTGSAGAVGGGMGGVGGMMGKLTNALFIFTMLPAVLQAVADSASNVIDSMSGQNESIAENIKLFGSLAVATGLLIAAKNREAIAGALSGKFGGKGGFLTSMQQTARSSHIGAAGQASFLAAAGANPAAVALSKKFSSIGKSLTNVGTKISSFGKGLGPLGSGLTKAGGAFTSAAAGAVGPLSDWLLGLELLL